MSGETTPDFNRLRAERDAAFERDLKKIGEDLGWDASQITVHRCLGGCYCACPDGPCEHDFQGWRDFEDGSGGEQVCSKCGMGAMSHDMRVGP